SIRCRHLRRTRVRPGPAGRRPVRDRCAARLHRADRRRRGHLPFSGHRGGTAAGRVAEEAAAPRPDYCGAAAAPSPDDDKTTAGPSCPTSSPALCGSSSKGSFPNGTSTTLWTTLSSATVRASPTRTWTAAGFRSDRSAGRSQRKWLSPSVTDAGVRALPGAPDPYVALSARPLRDVGPAWTSRHGGPGALRLRTRSTAQPAPQRAGEALSPRRREPPR